MDELENEFSEDNRAGEILVRGPSVMSGYMGNPAATEAAFIDGWLKTGDIGYRSSDGKWYVCDRAKEIIKVRGWQVSPAELEDCLLTHPSIVDAAVIGVDDSESSSGELPRAYIVLHEGDGSSSVTEAEIQNHFRGRLARYKALAGGVRIVDRIPKSSSGKILRKALKEMAEGEKALRRRGEEDVGICPPQDHKW